MRIFACYIATILSCVSAKSKFDCVGCGSNVVDRFFRVRAVPKVGEKGFFYSPTKILEDSVVGGVTLNHLAWAARLGVPSGLLALQGDDSAGKLIRDDMIKHGVELQGVEVDKSYTTAESYVLSQPHDGERSIIMASGSTSNIDKEVMTKLWNRITTTTLSHENPHQDSSPRSSSHLLPKIVTTEVSQVPLSGVLQLLELGNQNKALTVLDVDVSPSVCVNEARLGSMEELIQCVKSAKVLKPTMHAAQELLQILLLEKNNQVSKEEVEEMVAKLSNLEIAVKLRELCESCLLVAITVGGEGCVLSSPSINLMLEACPIDKVLDATGAGDAFLGGLVAGLYKRICEGKSAIPEDKLSLIEVGKLANAAGAACCQVLGGLPNKDSLETVLKLRGGGKGRGYTHMKESSYQTIKKSMMNRVPLRGGGGGGADVTTTAMSEFKASLQMDALTLSHLAELFTQTEKEKDENQNNPLLHEVSEMVKAIAQCKGRIHITGIGKSGIVARRFASSLASTGSPAHFTHASEWVHGDLGNAKTAADSFSLTNTKQSQSQEHLPSLLDFEDIVIALSHSGAGREVLEAVDHLKDRGLRVFSLTSFQQLNKANPLVQLSCHSALYQLPSEVTEPFGGAPTCSIVAMEALVNAIVTQVAALKGFDRSFFKKNHPGGALGKELAK